MKPIYKSLILAATLSLSAPAFADEFCQYVDYVRIRLEDGLGVSGAKAQRGNAKDWGGNLQALGLRWFGTPRIGPAMPGDVVVFQPTYRSVNGGSFDQTYGHIAYVESASYDSAAQTWTITIFSANQGGALRSDSGCNNVSTLTTTYRDFASESQRTVSFYYLH